MRLFVAMWCWLGLVVWCGLVEVSLFGSDRVWSLVHTLLFLLVGLLCRCAVRFYVNRFFYFSFEDLLFLPLIFGFWTHG